MKSQFLGRNDKETGTGTGNTRKLSLRSAPKSAWVPNTPSAHKLLIFECQILFSVQLSRASCQQITSKCEVSLHHALHHAYHASYCIILDHIGSYWITGKLLSTLLVCRRRTREGCTQHKSHRTSRLWNQSEPVSRILQEHWPKHRVGP